MGDNPRVGDGGRLDDVNPRVGDGRRLDDVNPRVGGDGGRLDDVNERENEVLPAAARWWECVRSNLKWVAVAVGGITVTYYLCRRISRVESVLLRLQIQNFVVDVVRRMNDSIVMSMIWERRFLNLARNLDFQQSRRYRMNWRMRGGWDYRYIPHPQI